MGLFCPLVSPCWAKSHPGEYPSPANRISHRQNFMAGIFCITLCINQPAKLSFSIGALAPHCKKYREHFLQQVQDRTKKGIQLCKFRCACQFHSHGLSTCRSFSFIGFIHLALSQLARKASGILLPLLASSYRVPLPCPEVTNAPS